MSNPHGGCPDEIKLYKYSFLAMDNHIHPLSWNRTPIRAYNCGQLGYNYITPIIVA